MPLPDDLTVEQYMEHYMPRALERHAAKLDGIDCVLQFDIWGDGGGSWALAIQDRKPTVTKGAATSPRCTFKASEKDWLDLVRGKLNGPMAFMTGRIKMEGDYFYAMKLGQMLVSAMASLKK
jgi:putative sterol carrier protein